MTVKKLDILFGELKEQLSDKHPKNASFLSASYLLDKQMKLCHLILEKMGVDLKRTRLDTSTHPFYSRLYPADVRLTTHTSLTSFYTNLSAVIHEGGHTLYALGLPSEDYGTPLGEFCSMAVYEK